MAVTNMREINYRDMSEDERKGTDIWRLDDLYHQYITTDFYVENDYYALYEDLDRDADDNCDDRKYAVYLKKSGKLLCLLVDSTVALNGYEDTDYGAERSRLYREIAKAAGWPEKLKHYMTWRELRDRLNEFPDRILDMTAWVYVHGESAFATDGEFGILNVSPTYSEDNFDFVDEDNHMSISIDD